MQLSKVLILCCALALLALPTMSVSAPHVLTKTMIIRVVLHPDRQAVTKACNVQVGNKILPVQGCVRWMGKVREVHAIHPKSWCDINRLDTLGHEVMHLMGFNHSPNYAPPWLQPEAATGCMNGGWWTPPTNPRP